MKIGVLVDDVSNGNDDQGSTFETPEMLFFSVCCCRSTYMDYIAKVNKES